jgi:hypothetical protein
MKLLTLLAVTIIALASSAAAQHSPHVSREAVVAFLRHEGILNGKTRMEELIWNDKAHWWSVSLRHPSGKITNWTVDADARNYSYVCQH